MGLRLIRSGKNTGFRLSLLLLHLGDRINESSGEAESDSENLLEGDNGVKEQQTEDRNWQFVERTGHRVSGGRSHTNAPARAVRNTNGKQASDNHHSNGSVTSTRREVELQVLRGPVLENERPDAQDRDRQHVVVVHGIHIPEAKSLDALIHDKDECSLGEAV